MRSPIGRLLVCTCWVALLVLAPCAHARRIALVIGNDNYVHADKLVNAGNDANAMAQALQSAGFSVVRHRDLGREGLFKAVDSFVQGVARDDEVVVFFSGHGVQIDAAPYLLPVDIKADTPRQLTRDALPLDALVADLSKARYTLVVVDACRNNPFATRGLRNLGSERGLQPIEPPEGTAIIFSAGRGQAALDTLGQNDTERQGVFTREFLRQMNTPGLQVRDLLLKVRDAVEQKAATVNHKQRPALIDESRGMFFFYPPAATAAAGGRPGLVAPVNEALAVEIAFWNSVQESGSAQELKLYLKRYPNGQFADLARARIDRIEAVVAPSAAPAAASAAARPAGPGDAEAQRQFTLAQKGNAAAMARVGWLYQTGQNGVPRDDAQAARWYRQGAEAGNGHAMAGMGVMYENGRGGLPKDGTQAVAWYRKGADAGDGRSMNNLGAAYAVGRGNLPRDETQAATWYRRAADAGWGRGMTNMGWLYDGGRGGLPRDEREALAWFRRGVEAGDANALAAMGYMMQYGRGGLARDEAAAIEWYRKGVAQGDGQAMLLMGIAQMNGQGLPKDDVQAVAWYRKSIDAGLPRGLALLGYMYESGRGGLVKDEAEALALYRRGAEAGDRRAMNNLGALYMNGRGGLAKDETQALTWYRRSADMGDAQAMFNLGHMYGGGRGGLQQDPAQARQWFERAAAIGHEGARAQLVKTP